MVHPAKLSVAALDGLPPWQTIATKALAGALKVDPYVLGMRRYRGLGPPGLPKEWIKGNVNAYRVADLLRWLGDSRADPEQYASALGELLCPHETSNHQLVCLFARTLAEKTDPVGFEFTQSGRLAYLQSIYSL